MTAAPIRPVTSGRSQDRPRSHASTGMRRRLADERQSAVLSVRATAAADEVDRMIRDNRALVFSHAEDRHERPAGQVAHRWTVAPG